MRILLIGKTGQLAEEVYPLLTTLGEVIALDRTEFDLGKPDSLAPIIQQIQPNVMINAAAYTAVDQAESEPEIANLVNGVSPGILSQEAQKLGATLIHISTDYVFDGTHSLPYLETDLTHPLGVYGSSKLAGELAIKKHGGNPIIIRTAWVYGVGGKGNFVKTMLRLGKDKEEIRVVSDQIGSPTWTGDLAHTITQIIPKIQPEISGIYHYTNSGVASWYDFAVAIFEEAEKLGFPLKIKRVIPITTTEYPTPAKRPNFSVLSTQKISKILQTYPPHWRQSLTKMLTQMSEAQSP